MNTLCSPPTPEAISQGVALLREGQLVAFPTETVYGLGANALNPAAVARIFEAKGRPSNNPLIVHVADASAANGFCHISQDAHRLMDAFCPGPLTLLLPKKDTVLPIVNAGLASVAVRIPSHPVAQALLQASGLPIVAPSANTSGRPSPTTAAHVLADLDGIIPLVLDGGSCSVGLESTVLDMTTSPPTVLRPGGITPDMLRTVVPDLSIADSVLRPLRQEEKAPSPGMMYRHYAPKGQLTLVKGAPKQVRDYCLALYRSADTRGLKACILAFQEHLPLYEALEEGDAHPRVMSIGSLSQPETIAQALFATLRQLDEDGVAYTLCEVLPPTGLGLAIMNRLSRAASFRIIDAEEDTRRDGEL